MHKAASTETALDLESCRAAYPVWFDERIRNGDTDQFGHVNNTSIVGYCEAGRMALVAEPVIQKHLAGLVFVVASLNARFERELFYPGTVSIGTAVTTIGNSSFTVSQVLFGPSGRFASCDAVCVVLDKHINKPVRIPEAVRAYFARVSKQQG